MAFWPVLELAFAPSIVVICLVLYTNSLKCGFAFDDSAAIRKNEDLLPTTNWSKLLEHDFWGIPMSKESSHGSYRPLTVATFKLNYHFNELNPFYYHAVNVVLHLIVCLLFLKLCKKVTEICSQHDDIKPIEPPHKGKTRKRPVSSVGEELFLPNNERKENYAIAYISALLFTIHPIHTEAVTGIVGRAELLSAIFFLTSLLFYLNISIINTIIASIFCILATASKEQGMTVIGICILFDLFILHRLTPLQLLTLRKQTNVNVALRTSILCLVGALVLLQRFIIMPVLPLFADFEIPASSSTFPTRQMTYNYLLTVNAGLLLNPSNLLCDWSMGTIPLVTEITDPRNFASLLLWMCLSFIAYKCATGKSSSEKLILFGFSMLVIPFIPASNLFFPVGFVVAERVLYIPSMGFCVLVAIGVAKLWPLKFLKPIICALMAIIVATHSAKTILRNNDWVDDHALFNSALKITVNNAKIWNNIGHYVEDKNNLHLALEYYKQATLTEPTDTGSHINAGRVLNKLQHFKEAEQAFITAKSLLPKGTSGQPYEARIPPNYFSIFIGLANILKKNKLRLHEAELLYKEAIQMKKDNIDMYVNRGEILLLLNKPQEALKCYRNAMEYAKVGTKKADLYFNIGVVESSLGNTTGAMEAYTYAIYHNHDHLMALYNSAVILENTNDSDMIRRAKIRIDHILSIDPSNLPAMALLGSIFMDMGKIDEAESQWNKLLEIEPESKAALFNLAYVLSKKEGRLKACMTYLERLLQSHPDHNKGLLLYGEIMLNKLNNTSAAKKAFQHLMQIDPGNFQGQHNLCVVMVREGELEHAEQCFLTVISQSPDAKFAKRNLETVRRMIAMRGLKEQENNERSKFAFNQDSSETSHSGEAVHQTPPSAHEEELVYIEPMQPKNGKKKRDILLKDAKTLLEKAKKAVEDSKGDGDASLEKKIKSQNKAFESVREVLRQLQDIDKQMDSTVSNKDKEKLKKNIANHEKDPAKRKQEILDFLDQIEDQLT